MAGKPNPPSKDTPKRREIILDALRDGATLQTAAGLAGIDRDTLLNWRKADSAFSASCVEATAKVIADITSFVRAEALTDAKVATWFLERRDKGFGKDSAAAPDPNPATGGQTFGWADVDPEEPASDG